MRPLDVFRLLSLSVGHLCIDAYATMILPLVVYFAAVYDLSMGAASSLVIVSTVATSLTQPLAAWWGDRGMPRWVSLAGPALAGTAGALMFTASSMWGVVFWLVVSGLGVSILHPEGVMLGGATTRFRSSVGIAIFLFGGTIGIALGPLLVPRVITAYGEANSWLIAVPAILASAVMFACFPVRGRTVSHSKLGLREAFRGKGTVIGLLMGLNTVRGVATTGVSLALSWLAKERGGGSVEAGTVVFVFLMAGGLGSLVCGFVSSRRLEKPLLVLTMLGALPAIWVLPQLSGALFVVVLVVAGLLGNATLPTVIAMSQRMVPSGARVASSLMMGVSWCVGGTLASLLVGRVSGDVVFVVLALTMVPAAVCGLLVDEA